MEKYKKLVMELIEQEIGEYTTWNEGTTRGDALKDLSDNGFGDIFGNISGSRTYSTHEAQQFIDDSGAVWDEEILDLFSEMGDDYFTETLKRGAETLDVVICELIGSRLLYDMATEAGVEL